MKVRTIHLALPFAIALSFAFFSGFAQDSQQDSLLLAAESAESDTLRGRLLMEYAQKTIYSNPSEALEVALEARQVLENEAPGQALAKTIGLIANCYYISGQRENSRATLQEAIEVYKKIGDQKGAAVSSLNLGILYKVDGLLDSTMAVIERSMPIFESTNDTLYKANALQLRGTVYDTRGYRELALEDYLKALSLHRAIGSSRAIAEDLMTLSSLYLAMDEVEAASEGYAEAAERYEAMDNLAYLAQAKCYQGICENRLGNPTKAVELFTESLLLSQQTSNLSNEARSAFHLAQAFRKQEDLSEADSKIAAAIAGFRKTNNMEFLGLAELEAFEIYKRQGRMADALAMLDSAELHIQLSGSLSSLIDLEEDRSAYLLATKQFQAASSSLLKINTLRDSLSGINNQRRIEELKIIHDLEKKEQQLQIQEQQISLMEQQARISGIWRSLLIIGCIMLLLLLAVIYLVLRQRIVRTRVEKEKTALELAHRKQELTSFTVQLAQKHSALKEVKQELQSLTGKDSDSGTFTQNTPYGSVIKTLNRNLDEEAGWKQFVTKFEELNPDFAGEVREKYPDITSNELRLMALIKLHMANHDIANLLNISKDGVKKARYRLRKKLHLEQGDELDAVVQGL